MSEKVFYVSASQVTSFDSEAGGCERYWHYTKVQKLPIPDTEALRAGREIHLEVEFAGKNDLKVRDSPLAPYAEAMVPYIPPRGSGQFEYGFRWDITKYTGFACTWVGYIDILDLRNPVKVLDTKSTKDFKWAKTADDLHNKDVQLNSYVKYLKEEEGIVVEKGGLIYLRKGKPDWKKPPKKVKTLPVIIDLDHDNVDNVWNRSISVVKKMFEASSKDVLDLAANTNKCNNMFGLPCPFKDKCGVSSGLFSNINFNYNNKVKKEQENKMASFLDKLKKKTAEQNSETEGKGKQQGESKKEPSKDVSSKLPKGILPDDAPSRETPVKKEVAAEEKKPAAKKFTTKVKTTNKVAAKKPAKVVQEAEEAEEAEEVEAEEVDTEEVSSGNSKVKKTAAASSSSDVHHRADASHVTLFVGCIPVKGEGKDFTLLEDWLRPLIDELNANTKAINDQPDYRLLAFGPQKAVFETSILEALDTLPDNVVVLGDNYLVAEAVSILSGHVGNVVKGVR